MADIERSPWMFRPEMDRLVSRGLLPPDVDRVNVTGDGCRMNVFHGPDGAHLTEFRARHDPYRLSHHGEFDWIEIERTLSNLTW